MQLDISLRDAIYLGSTLIAIILTWSRLSNKVDKLRDSIDCINRKLYTSEGKFDLVDKETCRNYREQQEIRIRESDKSIKDLSEKINEMHSNILVIMTKMNGYENPSIVTKKGKQYG